MKISKALGSLLLAVLLVSLPCQVAEGNQGYAVYRDGVAMNLTWHAGIMVEPNSSNYGSAIAHAPGGSDNAKTEYASYNTFLNGKNFKGVYRPHKPLTDHERDLVVSTARYIAEKRIPYELSAMMIANENNGRTRFYPKNIQKIRCDGVVEYSYEYNGIPVYGIKYWDISLNHIPEIEIHRGIINVNPQIQANSMVQISTTKP